MHHRRYAYELLARAADPDLANGTHDDVCQQSLEALQRVAGISSKSVQTVLRALLAAGVIAKEETGPGRHANRYRLLLTVGNGV